MTNNEVTRWDDRRRYERIIDRYLRDCYAQRTVARVSELAQLLGAPRAHLSRTIARLFGKPLRQFLREKQLVEAKRLLALPDLRVREVAAASGFGHPSTFFRVFRAALGMTPTEYRQEVTNCDFTTE
jgi:AraC family transcriptional activator of pobA